MVSKADESDFYINFNFRSTPITARRPAARAVRLTNVTGVQKTASSKKSMTVRVEREAPFVKVNSIEVNRAGSSKTAVADVSIVDKLSNWEKKNDRDRTVAETKKGRI